MLVLIPGKRSSLMIGLGLIVFTMKDRDVDHHDDNDDTNDIDTSRNSDRR